MIARHLPAISPATSVATCTPSPPPSPCHLTPALSPHTPIEVAPALGGAGHPKKDGAALAKQPCPFSAINTPELVPMPPFGKAQGVGGLPVPFSLPTSWGAENEI